jgi:hypothetical protein
VRRPQLRLHDCRNQGLVPTPAIVVVVDGPFSLARFSRIIAMENGSPTLDEPLDIDFRLSTRVTRMPNRNRIVAVLAMLLSPLAAQGQARYTVGVSGLYGQPLGQFGDNVRRGFGFEGMGTVGLDSRGIFSLKAELGWIRLARKSEPFITDNGFDFVELESETTSGVLILGAGPQLAVPFGPLRPYAGGTIGFARFATNTSINLPANESSTGQKETLYEETVSSDFILSLTASGGVRFELPFMGRGILADLGARWHRNGEAEYVSSEGVVYNGSGRPTITPTRSEADFLVYRLGIVIPLGRSNVTVTP